jgi:hypothetical protein
MRYKGGVISATAPTTSTSAATGVWTLPQQMQALAAGNWPAPEISWILVVYQSTIQDINSFGGIALNASGNYVALNYNGSTGYTNISIISPNGSIVNKYTQSSNSGDVSQNNSIFYDKTNNFLYYGALFSSTSAGLQFVKISSSYSSTSIAKSYKWSTGFYSPPTTGETYATAVDSSQNVFIGGQLIRNACCCYVQYPAIIKLNSSGTVLNTVYPVSGTYAGDRTVRAMVINSSNAPVAIINQNSNQSPSILSLTSNLSTINWSKTLTKISTNTFNYASMDVDASDNYYIAGYETSSQYTVVVKYNSSGTLQWQRKFNIASQYVVSSQQAIKASTSGDVYVCCQHYSLSPSSYYTMLLKYNSSGTLQWQRKFSGLTFASGYVSMILDETNSSIVFQVPLVVNGRSSQVIIKYPMSGSVTGTYSINVGGSVSYTIAAGTGTDQTATYTETSGTWSATSDTAANNGTTSITFGSGSNNTVLTNL